MPISVPTYASIRDRILADIDSEMAASGATRGIVEYAIACALAGVSLLLHAAVSRAARDRVPSTARPAYMRQWAAFFGIAPKPAVANVGTATFAASPGSTIPADTVLRLRSGVAFAVDADAFESAGSIVVSFTASVPGAAGRAAPGTPIFLGSPVAGVATQGVVGSGGIGGGADNESDPSVLARLLARLRNPPGGGTKEDWTRWAKATPGVNVDRVFVRPNTLGPSSMKLLFTIAGSDPIPIGADELAVTNYVKTKCPADMLTVVARGPIAQLVNPVIQITPYTTNVTNAVTAALEALFASSAEPGGTIAHSNIGEAISGAPGETSHTIIIPTGDVVASSDDHLPMVGTPTYQA